MRLDGVDAVAVGAYRRKLVAPRDGLPVNAVIEGLLDLSVALAARGRDIEFVDRRFGVVGGADLVRAMAVSADSSFGGTLFRRAAVHAVLVGEEGLCSSRRWIPSGISARGSVRRYRECWRD